MKKLIALILSLLMLLPVTVIAASAIENEQTPIIYIRGNGEDLFNAQGEEIAAEIEDISLGENGEDIKSVVVEAVAKITVPFLFEGMLMDEWDNYGKAVYEELSPLFEEAILDGDGNPKNGTAPHSDVMANSQAQAYIDKGADGTYEMYDYSFTFDWRLDPYEHVDNLHEHIKTILDTTGEEQVSLVSRCLGGAIINAYLDTYGSEGLVKNVVYTETMSNGADLISKGFSSQLEFDDKAIQRYVNQMLFCGETNFGTGFDVSELANDIVVKSMDLFTQVNVIEGALLPIEVLYNRLYKALVPALFHSLGMGSQPIYWTCVKEEDFDLALDIMFGEKGSEGREYYAGLIEKILHYRERITSKLPEIYTTFKEEYGVHIGSVVKYGYINDPITEGRNELSDGLVCLNDASFGATTAAAGTVLTDDYINGRIAEGKGKYISFDKEVDTSTALFPDTTWVIKKCSPQYFCHRGCNCY
ncbi:MAG: hypothetical protein IJB74_05415 [Clostridia bacterium]|nr:hypothetical protein [Clostridia bacterium]